MEDTYSESYNPSNIGDQSNVCNIIDPLAISTTEEKSFQSEQPYGKRQFNEISEKRRRPIKTAKISSTSTRERIREQASIL